MRISRMMAVLLASELVLQFMVATPPDRAQALSTVARSMADSARTEAPSDALAAQKQAAESVWIPPELSAGGGAEFVEPSRPFSPPVTGVNGRSAGITQGFAGGGPSLDVDGVTGALSVTATDLATGGATAVGFSRVYGSQSTVSGMLGTGWATSLDNGLRVDGTGVVIFTSFGARVNFTPRGTGFDSPKGLSATLSRIADSGERAFRLANPAGESVYFSANGYVTAELDRFGRGTIYRYDNAGRPTIAKDGTTGRYLRFDYQGDSRLLQALEDNAGRTVSYGYDGQQRLAKVTDVSGATTTFDYDDSGKLTNIGTPSPATDSGLAHRTISYNAQGRAEVIAEQWSSKIVEPHDDATTTFLYSPGSATVTDARGNIHSYEFDAAGRTKKVSDADGISALLEWVGGRLVSTAGPDGAWGQYGYDDAGRQITTTLPTGATSTTVFSTDGGCSSRGGGPDDVKCLLDPQGNRVTVDYDTAGLIDQVRDDIGVIGQARYSVQNDPGSCSPVAGLLCSSTDGRGVTTSYTRDAAGNITSVGTAPIGGGDLIGATKYEYDSLGRPVSLTRVTPSTDDVDPVTRMAYDRADRLVHLVDSDGSESWLGYNADGSREFSVGSGTFTTFEYDSRGYLLQESSAWADSAETAIDTAYEYDAMGNRISVSTRSGTTKYHYNADGLVTAIEQPGGDCAAEQASSNGCIRIAYDADGREVTKTFPGGATQSSSYDTSSRIALIDVRDKDDDPLERVEYNYTDPNGKDTNHISSRATYIERPQFTGMGAIPPLTARATTAYGYDSRGRLTSAVERDGEGGDAKQVASWSYSYDSSGNRVSQTVSGRTSPTTDHDTPPTTTTFTYDALNRITSTSADSGKWVYDGEGRQLNNGIANSGISTTGDPVSNEADNNPSYIAGPDGELIGYSDTSGSHYYVKDINGSVIVIVDGKGRFGGAYRYSPFGETVKATGDAENNRIRFLGRYEDRTAPGVYQLGARAYDASLGRFLEPDASEIDGRSYAYALQDPVNFLDTNGFKPSAVLVGRAGEIVLLGTFLGLSLAFRASERTVRRVRAILAPINGMWWALNTYLTDGLEIGPGPHTPGGDLPWDIIAHGFLGSTVQQLNAHLTGRFEAMWIRQRERAARAAENAADQNRPELPVQDLVEIVVHGAADQDAQNQDEANQNDLPVQDPVEIVVHGEANQDAQNQPGAEQPGADQPGAEQPGADQPGVDQPGVDQPGVEQGAQNQPGADQPEADQNLDALEGERISITGAMSVLAARLTALTTRLTEVNLAIAQVSRFQ